MNEQDEAPAGLVPRQAAADIVCDLAAGDRRWTNALNTGYDWLLQEDAITFDPAQHELTVNSPSGKTYQANGACQCEAFQSHQACWHRAAARLVRRALESRLHEVEQLADALWADATSGTWYDARMAAGAQLDSLFGAALLYWQERLPFAHEIEY